MTESSEATGTPEAEATTQSVQADGAAIETAAAGEAKDGTQAAAPITYEAFTLQDGLTMEAESLGEVTSLFSELGLPQDKAQKIVDTFGKVGPGVMKGAIEKLFAAEADAQVKAWEQESRTATDIGGANFDAAISESQAAIARFGSPAFKALLDTFGLGNHPEVIRTFRGIGKAISEDTHVKAGTTQIGKKATEVMYDHPTSKANLKYG